MNNLIENPLLNLKFDLAQNMLYGSSSVPSLRNLIATRVAIYMWQNSFRDMEEYSFGNLSNYQTKWINTLALTLNNASRLLIPNDFKNLLTDTILLIDSQVNRYFNLYYNPDVCENLDIYLKNLCWTQQGTINILKTAENLVTNTNLSTMAKYYLACNNCLKENIFRLYVSLPNNFINNFIKNERYLLVFYWTFLITGVNKSQYNFANSFFILNWAIKHGNEVAVQYIWENIIHERRDEKIVSIVGSELLDNSNMYVYFVTLLNNNQLEEFCQGNTRRFLSTLLKDMRWEKLLCNITKYLRQLIESIDRNIAVDIVSVCFNENELDRDQYILLVDNFVHSLATIDYIKFEISCNKLVCSIFISENANSRMVLLRKYSFDDKKHYLYDGFIKRFQILLPSFIELKKYNFLDPFLREMLNNKIEEIKAFKNFYILNAKTHFMNMILKKNYITLNGYMEWLYGNNKYNFKRFFPYDDDSKLIIELLEHNLPSDSEKLSIVKKFIKWCFNGNIDKISEFKAKTLHLDDNISVGFIDGFLKFICKLIKNGDLNSARKFLKWGVCTSDKDLYFERKVLITEKLWHVVIRDNNLISKWKWFIAFTTSCLRREQIIKFKANMDQILLALIQYLKDIRSTETSELLEWSYPFRINEPSLLETNTRSLLRSLRANRVVNN